MLPKPWGKPDGTHSRISQHRNDTIWWLTHSTHTAEQEVGHSRTCSHTSIHEHLACAIPSWHIKQHPQAIIICHLQYLHAAILVVPPQVGSIDWGAESFKPGSLHRQWTHTKFPFQHVCLRIHHATLSLNVPVIRQFVSQMMSQVFYLPHYMFWGQYQRERMQEMTF